MFRAFVVVLSLLSALRASAEEAGRDPDFGELPDAVQGKESPGTSVWTVLPRLQACVAGHAGEPPELILRVSPDGSARVVQVRPPLADGSAERRCLDAALEGWHSVLRPANPKLYRLSLAPHRYTDVDAPSVDEVAGHIRLRIRSVQQCYERELRDDRTLAGKIVARFTIGTDGAVHDASATEDTVYSPVLAGCILHLVRSWTFPLHPEKPAPVSFPFVFSPSDGTTDRAALARGTAARRAVLALAPRLGECVSPGEEACVAFSVAPDGSTREPQVLAAAPENAALSGCVAERIAAWKSAQPAAATTRYKLPLGPSGEACH